MKRPWFAMVGGAFLGLALSGAARAQVDAGVAADAAVVGDAAVVDEAAQDAAAPEPASDGGVAVEQEVSAREDELFGGAETSVTAPTEVTGAESVEELSRIDEAEMVARAVEGDDTLALGARFFLRTQYLAFDQGDYDEDFILSSANLLDVYLDGRPNDRLRGYVRARLLYNPSVGNDAGDDRVKARAALDQLWLKFDVARTVFVTVGKQRIKWGAGHFWNPTDALNQEPLDPLAVIDTRLGADLIKLHVPIESLAWNLYAIVDLQNVTHLDDLGGALRAEMLLGPAETALSVALKRAGPLRFGFDVSSPLGPIDIVAELALLHPYREGTALRYEGRLDVTAPEPEVPITVDRQGEVIAQLVIGFDHALMYSEEDSLSYGLEYFWNDLGYADASVYPLLLTESLERPPAGVAFRPLYNGRHYLAAFIRLSGPGSWNDHSFSLSSIHNLGRLLDGVELSESQLTGVVQFDYSVVVLTSLWVNAYAAYYYGEDGEFRYNFESIGLRVPTQLAAIGAGLRLEI